MTPVNWDFQTDDTVENLSRLIQARSVNPPGNEMPAIRVIKEILDREGFLPQETTILEAAPGRANLIARLRGDGSQRPLLLSGHVDVVPVEPEHWTHDPFSGQVIDGQVWGRGALDMKGAVAMFLQIFLTAFRQKSRLKRDLIFAAIADEEDGFVHGSRFLVDQHKDLIDAEFALNESGAMTIHAGGLRLYPIQVAEKSVCWLRMTARGEPGHGSMPRDDNAVYHLACALEALRRARHLPLRRTPMLNEMIQALAGNLPVHQRALVYLLRSPVLVSLVLRFLPSEARSLLIALMSNSVSPTVLQAGRKTNVIPSQAEAHLDCRLLPGQTPQDAIREILAITGKGVELEPIMTTNGNQTPLDTPLYRLMERATRQMDPRAIVLPMISPGATDAAEYNRAGIQVYGFTPGIFPEDFPWIKLPHGHDERIPVSAIRSGLPALWQVVSEFCQG
jgi:acetylornithine deacetylase/succinyl-diaminopimelate desuccinylase-like protein